MWRRQKLNHLPLFEQKFHRTYLGIPQVSSHIFQRDPMDMQGKTSLVQYLLFSEVLSSLVP